MGPMVVTALGADGGERGGAPSSLLLDNLAGLLRRAGRRVLLLDAAARHACPDGPAARARAQRMAQSMPQSMAHSNTLRLDGDTPGEQIERAARGHEVVLVDAGGRDGGAWRPALIAARLALVPLAAPDADLERHYCLAARLNAARMFNPGLRVLFVPVAADDTVAATAIQAVRAYAAAVMAARVLPCMIDVRALAARRMDGEVKAGGRSDCADGAVGATACPPRHAETAAALAALADDIAGSAPGMHGAAGAPWLRRLALS